MFLYCFFFNDTATTEIYTLSLHDALPISTGELRRLFLVTCLRRNRNTQLRVRALGEIGALRDPEAFDDAVEIVGSRSEEHTSELQSRQYLVCRLLLEKKKNNNQQSTL